VNLVERAAWEAYERSERERVAWHEAAHASVASTLGGKNIDFSINREQGWNGVCVADLPGGLREQVTFALAGHVAARARVGGAVKASELLDLLELEHREDLARAVEQNPVLGAVALRDVERIVYSSMPQIEKAAAALVERSVRSMTGDAGIHISGRRTR
jgi:hypothetical protein